MDARRFPSSQSLGWPYILWNLSISYSDRRHDNDRSGRFASGGKLAGAGGGGFLVLFVAPDRQAAVSEALAGMPSIRPGFDTAGSSITYYEPDRLT